MKVLSCDGLTVRVGNRGDAATLLHDVNLGLEAGDLLGIVGTNGAGKTTLLRALAGLAHPGAGRVLLSGRPLQDWPSDARARRLAYLPQGHVVHWPLPGREVVALGRLPHGDAEQAAGHAAISAAMQATDTQAFANTQVQALSGGERARLMLARVLAGEPAVILADEPLAALDAAHQLHMLALLRAQAQAGRAIALVLHDLALAARFCTRVVVLQQGRVVADGVPADVLNARLIADAFGVQAVRVLHDGEACMLPWRVLTAVGQSIDAD